MAIGLVVTTDTFQIWFNKTNSLISYHDDNLISGQHSTTGNVSITGPASGTVGLYVAKTANINQLNVSSTGFGLNVSGNATFHSTVNVKYMNVTSDIYLNGTSQTGELNIAFRHANSAYLKANSVNIELNAAYIHVNAAYAAVNTGDSWARAAQNSTGNYANSSYLHANAAYAAANSAASPSVTFDGLTDVDTAGKLQGNLVYYKASTDTWNVAPTIYVDTTTGAFYAANSFNLSGANTNQYFVSEVTLPAASAKYAGATYYSYTQGLGGYSVVNLYAARGTKTSPLVVNGSDVFGVVGGYGYDGSKFVYGAGMRIYAAANWSASVNDTKIDFQLLKGDGDTPANYFTAMMLSPNTYGAEIYTYGNTFTEFNGSNGSWLARYRKYGQSNDSGLYLATDGSIELRLANSSGGIVHTLRGNGTSFLATSNADNVAIGNTSTPSEKLQITGNVKFDWSNSGIIFGDGTIQKTSALATINAFVSSSNATYGSTTNARAQDDNPILITEGANCVGCIITTTGTTDKVQIEFSGTFNGTSEAGYLALCRNSTVIHVQTMRFGDSNDLIPGFINYIDTPGTAGAQTYHVRYMAKAGTSYMNGDSGGRVLGGQLASTIYARIVR